MRHPVWPPILILMLLHASPVHPGQAERPVPVLLRDLQNQDIAVRRAAAKQLAARGAVSPDAIPVLLQAIRDPDPAVCQEAVQAFKHIKALPQEAIQAPTQALRDKNSMVRSEAAYVLQQAGVPSGQAGPPAQGQQLGSTPAQGGSPASPATGQLYTKDEIVRSILPDDEYKYPLQLESMLPVHGWNQGELLVTLYRGKDRPDRLAIWKKVKDKYQRLELVESPDEPGMAQFEKPRSFRHKGDIFIHVILLYSGTAGAHEDTIFAIGQDNFLHRVSLESAAEWYKSKLKKGEWVRSVSYAFSDGKLEYELYIANEGDANCCPTAGKVRGTYKVVKEGMYDSQKKERSTRWKMLVDTARREPLSDTK